MAVKQSERVQLVTLKARDVVMQLMPERIFKLSDKFLGSFTIVSKITGHKLKIMDNNIEAIQMVHVDCLKGVPPCPTEIVFQLLYLLPANDALVMWITHSAHTKKAWV